MKTRSLSLLKFLMKSVGWFALVILSYAFVMFILSRLPFPAEKTSESKDIAIFIKSNGVHTDVILPVHNDVWDWSDIVPAKNTMAQDSTAQFIAFGWGDRDFYLHTPTWADLKAKTACKAGLYLGASVMHTQYYCDVTENAQCIKIKLTGSQYASLCNYAMQGFENGTAQLIPGAHYNQNDNFYNGSGKYSIAYTCNSWANQALKAAGQKAALWTLTDTGIFCHYR